MIDYASATKPDVPSGTARELAERLGEIRPCALGHPITELQGPQEARGATIGGTQVHSVRVPSFVVSTEVIFGLPDERLMIRHDAGGTPEPYVAGTLLAAPRVRQLVGLTRGLDTVLVGSVGTAGPPRSPGRRNCFTPAVPARVLGHSVRTRRVVDGRAVAEATHAISVDREPRVHARVLSCGRHERAQFSATLARF